MEEHINDIDDELDQQDVDYGQDHFGEDDDIFSGDADDDMFSRGGNEDDDIFSNNDF